MSQRQLQALNLRNWDWDAVDLLPIEHGAEGRSRLLSECSAALAAGRSVAVMPEGKVVRSGSAETDVRTGAAELATLTGAPIVVLGSAGSDRFWRRGHIPSFVSLRRQPMVVVCAEVLQPEATTASTQRMISKALVAAEVHARERLARRDQQ